MYCKLSGRPVYQGVRQYAARVCSALSGCSSKKCLAWQLSPKIMHVSGGSVAVHPSFPRPWRHDVQISIKQLRRHHPDHRTNQPQRQIPNRDADGDLFPQPGMLIGLGSGGAVGRLTLGADVVEVVSHGALSVRLAKRRAQKKVQLSLNPYLNLVATQGLERRTPAL